MWTYVWNSVEVIVGITSVVIICYYLHRLCVHLANLSKKLAQNGDTKNASTVLLPVTKMDLKAECNTVLPVPIGAEMCHHKMEIVTSQVLHTAHEEKCVIVLQCTSCGTIDKTIAVTSPAPVLPVPPQPRSECRHSWIKEKTITLSSAFEQMEDLLVKEQGRAGSYKPLGKKKETLDDEEKTSVFDFSTAPAWMFQKKCVKERICSKCGEVDRVVTSNFDIEESEEVEEKPE